MKTPIIALNYKAYPESAGLKGMHLSDIAYKLASKHKKNVVVAPQFADLGLTAGKFPPSPNFGIFSQHFDSNAQGAFTGTVPPESLLQSGCAGSLLNHSEKKINIAELMNLMPHARKIGMELIVCADDVHEAVAIARLHPPCIAVEPPELIGSGISVSTARPEIVSDSVREIRKIDPNIKVLVGAGVSNAHDVKKSIELGAQGVLLASAFVKAKDPAKLLDEMLSAL
ncbi:MAG TPA: triose-phosphate isomerase [Candidatus Norongarragalinales archaeon]|nr:triose-phosphate isomerase [Candidatus Norongarragalinales archaeon]